MQEKIYYKDENLTITSRMITCHGMEIPLGTIEKICVSMKTEMMIVSGTFFLVSLILLPAGCYFFGFWGWLGLISVAILNLIWLQTHYRMCSELKILTGTETYKIFASMRKRDYISGLASVMQKAVEERVMAISCENEEPCNK